MALIFSASVGLLLSLVVIVMVANVYSQPKINVTILHTAVAKGAVCLDGSAPAYSYTEGYGEGSNSWIIFLQGGGWCFSTEDCRNRSGEPKGSSDLIARETTFSGILELNQSINPYFYNWHKAHINYCDGASFMSDIEHSASGLKFRGARIFKVMMEEMLSKGMKNARNAILAGTSAGGLATSFHCDRFRELFMHNTIVKCISDSGFFIHGKQLLGAEDRAQYFANVVATHELAKSLPISCTSKINPNLCMFPEYFAGNIKTPLFIIESAFEYYQIRYNLLPAYGGPSWDHCIRNFLFCNSTELNILRGFRAHFIEALLELNHSPNRGMFVDSFFRHGHLLWTKSWACSSILGHNLPENKSIGKAVGDWYFERGLFVTIDIRNDMPMYSGIYNNSALPDQECLATLSFNSYASRHMVDIVCIVMYILIPLLLY